jgi:hypothetical protein
MINKLDIKVGDIIANKETGTLYKVTRYDSRCLYFSLEIKQVKAPFHCYYPHPEGLAIYYERT